MNEPKTPDHTGHRIDRDHDCFAMNCKDLGPEVMRLREQVAELAKQLGAVVDAATKMRVARERKAMAGPDLTASIVAEQRLYAALDDLPTARKVTKTAVYTVDDGIAQPGIEELIESIKAAVENE